ncbi:MAG TPA: hypothetical protein VJU84_00710 [Pyrinomonadaceae bacterium]|nr:hypothetical protein [Pyrinomonadaceae bacterium]
MDYVDVSELVVDTGFGIYGCPVGIDMCVWNDCVQWNESDNEAQTQQEEGTRLWEILYVGGAKLQLDPDEILRKGFVTFQIHCITRDGTSTEAAHKDFKIEQSLMNGTLGLIIRYLDAESPSSEPPRLGDLGLVA